ncbi:BsuPI-related putative proteinase inhibitor [Planococcus shixiaomingii]|uniref:BsuPI-related putative proteinase inhibitor n=1 Tax=Planococcus shixiaomingii TaxID=3058393 RepID=UPI00260856EB|nr:BsuPI-related putative proteinase inhibitor [Planococcus sp. N022]WKA55596.1 BsuPI-related putative proteinase inhibitor [Planococcus sp. N022]
MNKKTWLLALLLLALALLLAACGTKDEGASNEPPKDEPAKEQESTDGSSGGILAGSIGPKLEKVDEDTYRYSLKNQTEHEKTFEFTSGQRFDFSLTNEAGEQAFLFSSVASYAQAMGEETMKQAVELSYEFDIPEADLEPGTYKLEAWLTPKEGPAYKAETEYVVE